MMNKILEYFGYVKANTVVADTPSAECVEDSLGSIKVSINKNGGIDFRVYYEKEYIPQLALLLYELNTGYHYNAISSVIKNVTTINKVPEDFIDFMTATADIIEAANEEANNDDDDEDLVHPMQIIQGGDIPDGIVS